MEKGQGRVGSGADVRTVEGAVDAQGRGQAGRAFGQFLVVAGRESTFAGQLGALDDLPARSRTPLAKPSDPQTMLRQCHMP